MIPLIKYQLKLCRILWDNRWEILNAAVRQMVVVLEREAFLDVAIRELGEEIIQGKAGIS